MRAQDVYEDVSTRGSQAGVTGVVVLRLRHHRRHGFVALTQRSALTALSVYPACAHLISIACMGVTAPTVNEIVRRRRAVTAEIALRLSRYFGTTAQLWQNLQSQYDLEMACQRIGRKVQSGIQPLARPDLAGTPPGLRRGIM